MTFNPSTDAKDSASIRLSAPKYVRSILNKNRRLSTIKISYKNRTRSSIRKFERYGVKFSNVHTEMNLVYI